MKLCKGISLESHLNPFSKDRTKNLPLLVSNDQYTFVEKVKSIYYNRSEWERISSLGIQNLQFFSRVEVAKELSGILESLFRS